MIFSVLFVTNQCLYRDSILWCYDHCWSHMVLFCSLSFCPWVLFRAVISMLDFLPVYPWYVDGYPGSSAIQSPRFHCASSTIFPFLSSDNWKEPQARFCIYDCTLCYLSSLGNAYYSSWTYSYWKSWWFWIDYWIAELEVLIDDIETFRFI